MLAPFDAPGIRLKASPRLRQGTHTQTSFITIGRKDCSPGAAHELVQNVPYAYPDGSTPSPAQLLSRIGLSIFPPFFFLPPSLPPSLPPLGLPFPLPLSPSAPPLPSPRLRAKETNRAGCRHCSHPRRVPAQQTLPRTPTKQNPLPPAQRALPGLAEPVDPYSAQAPGTRPGDSLASESRRSRLRLCRR